jgi:hypothetical protein
MCDAAVDGVFEESLSTKVLSDHAVTLGSVNHGTAVSALFVVHRHLDGPNVVIHHVKRDDDGGEVEDIAYHGDM